ncbi:MAG: hypothetical protein LHW49_08175 [Candidatus Cloacimonetes bacterium]|nr:hypothetical protein [Candidatus Cloacimonadota bacterium]
MNKTRSNQPVYVDELFGSLDLSDDGKKWNVIYTKPQHEKKLARWSQDYGIDYYLPQNEAERAYAYKKVVFTKPLFPGYFFSKCTLKEKEVLIRSGCIVNFLRVDVQEELIRDLKRILIARSSNIPIEQHIYLEKGMRVCFMAGPLKGEEGIVENTDNMEKVILNVNVMKSAVAITVNAADLKVIGPYDPDED